MVITSRKIRLPVRIRWMEESDLAQVFDISERSFEISANEKELKDHFDNKDKINMVAVYQHRVVGFFISNPRTKRIELDGLAVHPDFRKRSVGSEMITYLISQLINNRRMISYIVKETNLPAQAFLRRNLFRATDILRRYFRDERDAYLFRYFKIR